MQYNNNPGANKKVRANEHIRVPEVRLIDENGTQVGVVQTRDALKRAEEAGLDLVEVAATVRPPVCRIMDLGKYIYTLSKKEKESRKKQKVIDVKEIKMTSKIEEHDYQTKLRNARRFLERGDKLKLTLIFRGREVTHADLGMRIVNRMIQDLADIAEVERNAGLEGKLMQVYFAALPPQKKTVSAAPKAPASEATPPAESDRQ